MRVIAGRFKGRELKGPTGLEIRPTTDRVKEALFSILGSHVVGARVLDLYAGTGALGLEALSRGATSVTFVERNPRAVHVLKANVRACGAASQADIQTCAVETFLTRFPANVEPYGLVLADPPYDHTTDLTVWATSLPANLVAADTMAVLEHRKKFSPPDRLGPLRFLRTYGYGDTSLSIYRADLHEASA